MSSWNGENGGNGGNNKFKVCLLGDSGVGKTALAHRIMGKHMPRNGSDPTIGCEFASTRVRLPGTETEVKLLLWDTAGQETFRSFTASFLRRAHCVLYVFDTTNRKSFEDLTEWYMEALEADTRSRIPLGVVVAAKCDDPGRRQVSTEEAERFASSQGSAYVETSSLTGDGVNRLLVATAELCVGSGLGASRRPGDAVDVTRPFPSIITIIAPGSRRRVRLLHQRHPLISTV